jgi:hypothetical protein
VRTERHDRAGGNLGGQHVVLLRRRHEPSAVRMVPRAASPSD